MSLRDLTEELRSLSSSPGVVVAAEARESRIRDSRSAEDPVAGDLVAALRGIGYSAKEASCRVDHARTRLTRGGGDAEVAEEELLAEALRA